MNDKYPLSSYSTQIDTMTQKVATEMVKYYKKGQ